MYTCCWIAQVMRKLWLILLLCSTMAKADVFEELINTGKWANAKQWLLNNKHQQTAEIYYSRHIKLCFFLNELELGKAYCDSLASGKNYTGNLWVQTHYHWFLGKYYQFQQNYPASYQHTQKAIWAATQSNSTTMLAFAYVQMANTLRGFDQLDVLLYKQRLTFAKKAEDIAHTFKDDQLFYHAKIIQQTGLIWYEEAGRKVINPNETLKSIKKSTQLIAARFPRHPQVIHNLIISGHAWLDVNPDSAIAYYEKAEAILAQTNDFSHGILINLSSALFNNMEMAYEAKFNKTQNTDYLNRAIVWAKHNMWLLDHRLHYEGFYFYRRFDDKTSRPIEQRIANLYYKLYLKTRNTNYLSFTLKYAEFMHHRPIQQIGVTIPLYESLNELVAIENGTFKAQSNEIQQTDKLITQPKYISELLQPSEAFIAYFSYQLDGKDSVSFLIQSITNKKQEFITLTYSTNQLKGLADNINNALLTNDDDAYYTHAHLGYNLLLEPVVKNLPDEVNKLIIIPPSYFKSPIIFEGLVTTKTGHDFASFNYVFDKYNVSYEQSFTHYASFQKKKIAVNKVNIWSPDYSKTPYADLSESGIIEHEISTYFKTSRLKYTNKKELSYSLLNAPILQVSAHANGTYKNTERPRIYTELTNADSLFYDIDLEQLSGNTSLAVFAACKSNTGYMQANGVIDGFTRALLSSGGGGTVTSFLSIEESVTTETLALFYKFLGDGKSAADALYLSKLAIKQKYPNPRHWLAFTYTGANQSFEATQSGKYKWLILGGVIVAAALVIALVKFKA